MHRQLSISDHKHLTKTYCCYQSVYLKLCFCFCNLLFPKHLSNQWLQGFSWQSLDKVSIKNSFLCGSMMIHLYLLWDSGPGSIREMPLRTEIAKWKLFWYIHNIVQWVKLHNSSWNLKTIYFVLISLQCQPCFKLIQDKCFGFKYSFAIH